MLLNVREVYITFKHSHNVQHVLTLKSMYCLHVNVPNVFLTCGSVNILLITLCEVNNRKFGPDLQLKGFQFPLLTPQRVINCCIINLFS